MGASVGVTRVIGLASQILLGWLLSKGDFAIYAIASGASAIIAVFTLGGLQEILVQQQRRYSELAAGAMFLTLCASSLAAIIMLGIAVPLSRIYHMAGLYPLLAVLAIAIPLNAVAQQLSVKLQIDLRFREIAYLETFAAILSNVLTVGFAWAGLGAMSFVLPQVIVAIVKIPIFLKLSGRFPWPNRNALRAASELFRWSMWVFSGSIAVIIAEQGQFLIIGGIVSQDIVGAYFFGFRLADQVRALVASHMSRILMVAFSKLSEELLRAQRAFQNTLQSVAFLITPLSVLLVLLATPFEMLVWHGKWSMAIPAIQWGALGMLMQVLAIIGRTLMKSTGNFRLWAITGWIDAFAILIIAFFSAQGGSVLTIAAGLAIGKIATGGMHIWLGARCLSLGPPAIIKATGNRILLALLSGILTLVICSTIEPSPGAIFEIFSKLIIFAVCYVIGILFFYRPDLDVIVSAIRASRRCD